MLARLKYSIKDMRGDSLIEVLLAITVLSSVLYIAWATINRASQISFNAQKRITMVNAVKEQAELIKFKYTNNHDPGISNVGNPATNIPVDPCEHKSSGIPNPSSAFYINGEANKMVGVKQIGSSDKDVVWIQRVEAEEGYYDYYVRACWQSTGGAQLDENSHLVVRLNK